LRPSHVVMYQILPIVHLFIKMAKGSAALGQVSVLGVAVTLGVMVCLIPTLGRAARITPGITAELGYSDNLDFNNKDQRDLFVRLTPSISYQGGTPANSFSANASAGYTRYINHGDESELDSIGVSLNHSRQISPRFGYTISNRTSISYDPVEEADETGDLVRINDFGERTDQNTSTISAQYQWGPFTSLGGSYSFTYKESTDESRDLTRTHTVSLNGSKRFHRNWRGELGITGSQDVYSDDDERLQVTTTARGVYMMGPSREIYALASAKTTVSLSDDEELQSSVDEDTYDFSIGANYAFNPLWSMGGSIGVSYTDGEESEFSPIASFSLSYTQQLWSLSLTGSIEFVDASTFGESFGRTETRSVNLNYQHQLAPHWSFSLRVGYVSDIPQQDIVSTGTAEDQYRVATTLTWQTSQYSSLALKYTYVEKDNEIDLDDESQNEISLSFNYAKPYLW
jgi:hypothetical protein